MSLEYVIFDNASDEFAMRIGEIEKSLYADGEGWSANVFAQDMHNLDRLYIGAMLDGRLVAYVGMSYTTDSADILRLGVMKDFQRRHIATDLLQYAFKVLVAKKIRTVMLEVDSHNIKAIGLYEKLRFKQISVRKNYYGKGKDGLIYSLELYR